MIMFELFPLLVLQVQECLQLQSHLPPRIQTSSKMWVSYMIFVVFFYTGRIFLSKFLKLDLVKDVSFIFDISFDICNFLLHGHDFGIPNFKDVSQINKYPQNEFKLICICYFYLSTHKYKRQSRAICCNR